MPEGLIITVERADGQRFVAGRSEETTLIGRSSMADLRLVDPAISAVHIKVLAQRGRVHVQDLGSKNGTWLDGHPLTPQRPVEVEAGAVVDLARAFRISFAWGDLPGGTSNPFCRGGSAR